VSANYRYNDGGVVIFTALIHLVYFVLHLWYRHYCY